MKTLFFFLICTLLCFSCSQDDTVDCFTPPNPFYFEIVDATTEENLFTNGTFKAEDITLINILNENTPVEFTFITEDNYNIIDINSVGWQTEIVNFELKVEDETIFNLYVDATRKSEDGCNFTTFNKVEIQNAAYLLDNELDLYKILMQP
ncbi:conserved hypothetical protein [Formosa agariphila KMM 3901]|uniref:Lipoprotein n=1 Tax=Formosa agariphila (strain DSM 15362 / KCTC 12365 / LMG 23005 / KMM 3901 / M-2Alg 35-1) TaxID=1347342 RepID=T2KGW5_FORAG|nr:hypothetical protein [Formosa agariphila]CDF78025.1 conserved hypothetical protein [Formosa agariphila KMM 3901]